MRASEPRCVDPAERGAGGLPLSELDPDGELEAELRTLLGELTLEEKLSLLAGRGFWRTRAVPRLGLDSMKLVDGPRGVGFHSSGRRCTAFPTGIALGRSWDPELAREFGAALASEARAVGADVVLGPAVNICRTPLNGRTFEYFTEDPELNRRLTVACIQGIQSRGVAACVKHFAANNQETDRMRIDARVGEAALREIYLPAFESAVREADVWCVMAAYNAVNGTPACESRELLDERLRREWGFRGFVVSDWFAARRTRSGADCIRAGLNLEMPGRGSRYRKSRLRAELQAGRFGEADLDRCLAPQLRVRLLTRNRGRGAEPGRRNTPEHQQLARRMAAESIVVLKNDGDLLPLDRGRIRRLAVLGPRAARRHCLPLLGGSAGVWSPYEITPRRGLREALGRRARLVRDPARADAAVVCVGFGHLPGGDSEGKDRRQLELPARQQELIRSTVAANPNTVVVLVTGAPVAMDWIDAVPAVVAAWYPGMEGGRAIADLLLGAANPCGKLPVSFPRRLADSPAHQQPRSFPGDGRSVHYDEDVFVGYRHFDRESIDPLFPFGFGLSYTRFAFEDLELAERWPEGGRLRVSMTLTNTGERDGAEVVQLYLGPQPVEADRPPRELKAFRKVSLKSGGSDRVVFELGPEALACYRPEAGGWQARPGHYELALGSSSRDLHLRATVRYGD